MTEKDSADFFRYHEKRSRSGANPSSRIYARHERIRKENIIFGLVVATLLVLALIMFFYDGIKAFITADSYPANYWNYQIRHYK